MSRIGKKPITLVQNVEVKFNNRVLEVKGPKGGLELKTHSDIDLVIENNIPDKSISHCQLFFPDPWHKKRHHKRRIVQMSFLDLLSNKLKENGIVHIATDWEDYAEHILETLESHKHFKNYSGAHRYSERPKNRPLTKFENRGQKLGHGVWDIIFTKIKGG